MNPPTHYGGEVHVMTSSWASLMQRKRDNYWHWLVAPGSCCGEFSPTPLPWSLEACREDGLKGTFISRHTHRWHNSQVYTHTHISLGLFLRVCDVFYSISCTADITLNIQHMCMAVRLSSCLSVSVFPCFHCCMNLLCQDKVDYTNPLYSLTFHTLALSLSLILSIAHPFYS